MTRAFTAAGVRPAQWYGAAAPDALGTELDELMDVAGAPVTARRPWLACWARHHPEWTPWTVAIRRDGRLCGAALLARRVRHGIAQITLLGHGASDYASLPVRTPGGASAPSGAYGEGGAYGASGPGGPGGAFGASGGLSDAEGLAVAVAGALRWGRRPWGMRMEQLPVGDPVAAALCARLPAAELLPGDPAVTMRIDPPGADLRPLVGARARRNAGNRVRRLRRDGRALEIRRLRTRSEVRAALPEIGRVRAARNAVKGLDDHADPGDRAFWADITPLLADRGEAEVTEVRIDGELAAYAVCLCDGTAYRGWDTRFDPRFAAYAPGHLLREAILDGLAGGPWTEYDMMRGTEAYKNALPMHRRDLVELRAWSAPLGRVPFRMRRYAAAVRDAHPRLAAADHAIRHRNRT